MNSLKDTNQALQRLDQLQLEDHQILVTADVKALYTSIRHSDGLAATAWFLHSSNIEDRLIDLILTLLEFILRHNTFIFDHKIYLQLQGVWSFWIFGSKFGMMVQFIQMCSENQRQRTRICVRILPNQ
ncbi:uncharacterized protein LOC143818196 isoform X2 [Ranitomeya variabilis]|uniref:uncharacterized protein LOC143818196 isoform X2 n=1 Tax=Ranitomeya variabilis TaxID=490064 RepID=UPI0040569B43